MITKFATEDEALANIAAGDWVLAGWDVGDAAPHNSEPELWLYQISRVTKTGPLYEAHGNHRLELPIRAKVTGSDITALLNADEARELRLIEASDRYNAELRDAQADFSNTASALMTDSARDEEAFFAGLGRGHEPRP